MAQDFWYQFHAQSEAETQGDDQCGFSVDFLRGDNLDACSSNGAEHEKRCSTQDGTWHQTEDCTDDREETEDDEHRRNEIADVATGHSRELYHAVVLRENAVWEAAEAA